MGKNWVSILSVKGPSWNIPEQDTQDLTTMVAAALTTAKNETTRTPVVTAQCKEAFQRMEDKMRDIKKRYFYVPLLTEADLISLGLKPRDSTATPGKVPTAHVSVETYLVERHELGVRLVYVDGDPRDKENRGYRIWHSVIAPGETPPPANPEELRKSFYTQRRKDLIEFDFEDSGKTAYFAVQMETN
jgi:hypothetical protein